jgi:hypothetical protein
MQRHSRDGIVAFEPSQKASRPLFPLRHAWALLFVVLLMMAGCATLPQQRGQYIRPTLAQAEANSVACFVSVFAKYPSLYKPDSTTGALIKRGSVDR